MLKNITAKWWCLFRSATKFYLFYNILRHAASAITCDFIFTKMCIM